ncbi:signal-induced proliferation-associated 1-like protein 2 isoform 2-T3 [Fundulus diaphanus]
MDPPQIQGAPAVPKMGVRARVSNWPKKQHVRDVQPSMLCEPSNKLLENRLHLQSGSQTRFQVLDILSSSSSRSCARMKRSNSEVTISDFGSEDVGLVAISPNPGATPDRRYGSTSSVDWLGSSGFLEVVDQEPSAPPPIPEPAVLSPSLQAATQIARGDITVIAGPDSVESSADSRDSYKIHRRKAELYVLNRLRPQRSDRNEVLASSTLTAHRCFSHYDVQSVLFTVGGPQPGLLLSSSGAPFLLPSVEYDKPDVDGSSPVLSCPQFLNEMEEDMENILDLTCSCCPTSSTTAPSYCSKAAPSSCTNAAVSVLEACTETQLCSANLMRSYDVEHIDLGAKYYHKYFYNKDHQNFFGIDPKFGPVALSIRREALDGERNQTKFNYRIILRTRQLSTLRGSIMEDSVPSSSKHGTSQGLPLKDVLEFVVPELDIQSLRVASSSPRVPDLLLQLDQQELILQHTVGLLLCRAGQTTGDEMYNRETSSPALNQFLNMLSPLGPMKYQDQQSTSGDSTSTQSFYTAFREFRLMIHISTLPSTAADDTTQMLKTRLIGNDVVTVIFQEPDAPAFNLQNILSHFLCVFIIISVHQPCTQHTCYSVEVFRCRGIPSFGPTIPAGWTFPASSAFRDFLLTKIINAKHATCKAQSSIARASRARQEQLKQLVDTCVTLTPLDFSNVKFSFISLGGKKKERSAPQPQAYLQSSGGLTWSATVRDPSSSAAVACQLAISSELVVLIEEAGRKVVFNCSCRDVIGWSAAHGSIKLFYQRGLCVMFSTRDGRWEDSQKITQRLQLVTRGGAATNVTLRRNRLGQLGFHVNVEGVVADVEAHGFAWQAGLRPGCRLVEICSVATVTLSHQQIIELLRTSTKVAAVILPPHKDGTPRRGFSETYRLPLLEGELASDVTSCPYRVVPPSRLPSAPSTATAPSCQSPTKRSWSSDMKEGSRAPLEWLRSSDESTESTQDKTQWTGRVKETKPAYPPHRGTTVLGSIDRDSSSTQERFAARSCSSCSNTLSSNSSDGRTSTRQLVGLRGLSVDSGIDSTTSAMTAAAGATLVLADIQGKETARPNRRLTSSVARPSCHPIRDVCVCEKSASRCSGFAASSPQKHLIHSKSLDTLSLASCGRTLQTPIHMLQRRHSMLLLQIISSQPPLQNSACSPSYLSDNQLHQNQEVKSGSTTLDSDITAALSVSHLEEIVYQLQLDLLKEQQEKAALQQEVLNLRQDNLRLQEEAHSAAEHIRRFSACMLRRRSFP